MPASSAANASPSNLNIRSFALCAVQLGLLLHAIRTLRLEESFGLGALAPVVFFGFCLHAWTPARFKLPVFFALSITALVQVLNAPQAAILIALGFGVFGICHLPVSFAWRTALLASSGAALIPLRTGWIESDWASAVLPILGSMFMFRSAVYLYDLRTERKSATIWMRLSYFFLLPNVCFLLFPVVDYRTFQRTYYEEGATRIHQRGLAWMLRGVLHLLLYRVVYYYLAPSSLEIESLFGVLRFVVSSYLLYLRISGHFHLIVGMLHLFGFHLPETNHNYLFASSFTDTWRRINLYWTEFMKKIVYYPTFMRLRRRGTLFGMIGATVATFVATWLFHSYQWFWLNGSFPLASDGVFWALAGALALAATLWEAKRGPQSGPQPGVPSWPAALRRSIQVLATFCLIALIWSVWCAPDFSQWMAILAQAKHAPDGQAYLVAGSTLALLALGTAAQRIFPERRSRNSMPQSRLQRAVTAIGILLVAAVGHEPAQASLGESFQAAVYPITRDVLNARDQERQTASYYDRLVEREGFGGRVWEEVRLNGNDLVAFMDSPLADHVESPLLYKIRPSSGVKFSGVVITTNRWGMRDRNYSRKKPKRTFRMALLGTCYEMGVGVADEQTWESLAERQLNRNTKGRSGLRYEILNFSVPGYTPYQQLQLVRDTLPAFDVDVVLFSNHLGPGVKHLMRVFTSGEEWHGEFAELFEEVGASPALDLYTLRSLLAPQVERLRPEFLAQIVAACRDMGALPVFLDAPFIEYPKGFDEVSRALNEEARQAGFLHLKVEGAWDGMTIEQLELPGYQHCPSPLGHRRMSAAFCKTVLENSALLGIE